MMVEAAAEAALGLSLLKSQNLADLASPSTARTNLGVAIGTNVQAYNARLQDISTNLTATSGTVEKTGADTFGTYTVTTAGKALLDDVDAADANNPLACVEYVEDQYQHYREKECRPGYDPSYMGKQPYINVRMRAILVDWLVEVHLKFKVSGWLESGEQLQGLQMGRWAAVSSEVM